MKFYSQDGQDKFLIEKIFSKKRDGFFIDVGAFDGVTYSNTYALETEYDWKGICIEPNPLVFEKLAETRKSVNLNYCIANYEKEVQFVSISGYGSMLSGILEFFDKNYLERIEEILAEHGGTKEIIKIKALTLQKIIEKDSNGYIDYCNIDVEGGEIEVLNSIDFTKSYIKIFSIENAFNTSKVRKYLRKYGYSMIAKLGVDEIFEKDSTRYKMIFRAKFILIKRFFIKVKQKLKKLF